MGIHVKGIELSFSITGWWLGFEWAVDPSVGDWEVVPSCRTT